MSIVSLATFVIVPGSLVTPSSRQGEIGKHCKLARLTRRGLIREYARLPVLINVKAKVCQLISVSTVILLLLISFLKDAYSSFNLC